MLLGIPLGALEGLGDGSIEGVVVRVGTCDGVLVGVNDGMADGCFVDAVSLDSI